MFGAFLVGLAASASRPVLEALSSGARRRLIASPGGGLQLGEEIVQPPKEGWFDGATVGACTVRRMGGAEPKWCMWYAGRSVGFASDVMPIATGCVGVAVSHDGITWEQACGEGAAGECFGPDGAENGAFDAAHVGVGDVVDGARRMLYFGGGSAPTDLGGRSVRGVAMGIGMATSTDGVRWERSFGGKALLLPRAGEQMFLGWPCAHREYVYYHASDVASYGGKFAIARARVTRTEAAAAAAEGELGSFSDLEAEEQYVLVPGEPGTFDAGGVSARSVVDDPRDGSMLLMAYEAQDEARRHTIGLARSSNGGRSWERVSDAPILTPSDDEWDGGAVARPCLISMGDGRARLYYLGRSADGARQGIGLAESVDAAWTEWRRLT